MSNEWTDVPILVRSDHLGFNFPCHLVPAHSTVTRKRSMAFSRVTLRVTLENKDDSKSTKTEHAFVLYARTGTPYRVMNVREAQIATPPPTPDLAESAVTKLILATAGQMVLNPARVDEPVRLTLSTTLPCMDMTGTQDRAKLAAGCRDMQYRFTFIKDAPVYAVVDLPSIDTYNLSTASIQVKLEDVSVQLTWARAKKPTRIPGIKFQPEHATPAPPATPPPSLSTPHPSADQPIDTAPHPGVRLDTKRARLNPPTPFEAEHPIKPSAAPLCVLPTTRYPVPDSTFVLLCSRTGGTQNILHNTAPGYECKVTIALSVGGAAQRIVAHGASACSSEGAIKFDIPADMLKPATQRFIVHVYMGSVREASELGTLVPLAVLSFLRYTDK
jgi:hypothetical protein